MIRTLILLMILIAVPPVGATVPGDATARRAVSADELISIALTHLQSRAEADAVAADFKLAGRVNDLTVAGTGDIKLEVDFAGPWLRPRVGVPVRIMAGATRVSSVTIWYAVSATSTGDVYDSDYPRGAPTRLLKVRTGDIDLARTHGRGALTSLPTGETRLTRAVRAGQPMLAADFEPLPAVVAQQDISIETGHGSVRLVTKGKALADGALGQFISVLAVGATQPIRARVVSDKVVSVEN